MPSHQRFSPTSGRKEESADTLREQLTKTTSKLNELQARNDKLADERDEMASKLEKMEQKKLQAEADYAALLKHSTKELSASEAKQEDLQRAYDNLKFAYDNPKTSSVSSMNSSLPDRTRDPRTSRRDRDERDRAYEKEREREKRDKKDRRAEKEQKERLEQRFEERPDRTRPPTSKRRSSHIEPWGSGSGTRSASATPLNRRSSGRVGTFQVAQGAYTPRTANPHSSSGVYSSGSSAVFDDERDDGNYRMHSIK